VPLALGIRAVGAGNSRRWRWEFHAVGAGNFVPLAL